MLLRKLLLLSFLQRINNKKMGAEGLSKTVHEHFKICFVCVCTDSPKLQATAQSHHPEPKISGRAEAVAGGAGCRKAVGAAGDSAPRPENRQNYIGQLGISHKEKKSRNRWQVRQLREGK